MSPTPTPSTPALDRLDRLEGRIARIESAVSRMAEAMESLAPLAAMAADTFDEETSRLYARGVDVDARVRHVGQVVETVTAPEVLSRLEAAAVQASKLEDTLGMVGDIVDEWLAGWTADGLDHEARIQQLAGLLDRLTQPKTVAIVHALLDKSDAVLALVDSPAFADDAVGIIGQAAEALVDTRTEAGGKAGLFGALGALNDPEVQRALDFAIRFGRRFGRSLDAPSTTLARS